MSIFSTRRVFVGLDAGSVSVAVVDRGPRRARLAGLARRPLDPGALEPGASGPNVARPDEVAEALRRALAEVEQPGPRATLVLPDGIARLSPIEVPAGAVPADYVRFRLGASLPWPASEASFDFLEVARRRVIGAAVRRGTVARYEQVAVAAGMSVDRVHLAPLMGVEGLLARGRESAVHVLLGDVALCLAGLRDGQLFAFRSRRRDRTAEEALWLREEAERATATPEGASGNGRGRLPLLVSGPGSDRLCATLGPASSPGFVTEPDRWPEATEAAWLVGALA